MSRITFAPLVLEGGETRLGRLVCFDGDKIGYLWRNIGQRPANHFIIEVRVRPYPAKREQVGPAFRCIADGVEWLSARPAAATRYFEDVIAWRAYHAWAYEGGKHRGGKKPVIRNAPHVSVLNKAPPEPGAAV